MDSIKAVRKAKGLSLSEVANRTGLYPQQVARAERAGVDTKASTLVILAKALGVPVCELFNPKEAGHGRRRKP